MSQTTLSRPRPRTPDCAEQRDRVEIETLRAEFTDAALTRDWDRFASLFTPDGAWRMPYVNVEFLSREEIRAGIERMQGLWDYFLQTAHPGTIELAGDTAVGRTTSTDIDRDRKMNPTPPDYRWVLGRGDSDTRTGERHMPNSLGRGVALRRSAADVDQVPADLSAVSGIETIHDPHLEPA